MVSTETITSEENLVRFLKEPGETTLNEMSSALSIPKYNLNSICIILYSPKSKNIVKRKGNKWALKDLGEGPKEKLLSENKTHNGLIRPLELWWWGECGILLSFN